MGNKGSSKLCPEALSDLAGNTNFSEDEIRIWYKDFKKDFPNGYLTIDQFKDVYIQHFPNGDATKFSEHIFRTFDHDNNHQLDFREFLTALSVIGRGSPQDRLRWAFSMYDIDENGYISKRECVEIIKAVYATRAGNLVQATEDLTAEDRCDKIFTDFSKTRKNDLTEAEYLSGYTQDEYIMNVLNQDHLRY